jgi:hypothetical protein
VAEFIESGTGPQIDVKQTAAYRWLKAAVIILGVLILLALGVLVVGFAVKLGGHRASGTTGDTFTYAPPPGAKLVSMEISNDRLIIHLKSATAEEVDIIDTDNGHLVARLKFAPAGP